MKTSIDYKTDLNALVEIVVEPNDYDSEFKKELNSYRKKVQLKGFRKGKTPIGVVKKMYGQHILADVVSNKIESELNRYLTEEKLNVIGQPLPVINDDEPEKFEVGVEKDYNFQFEIGLSPKFEISDLVDGQHSYYQVELSEEELDKSLLQIRRSKGERVNIEKDIEDNDMVTLNVKEQNNEKKVKTKGLEASFSVLVSRLSADYQKTLIGGKLQDTFDIDIYELEPDTDDEFVRKHFLKLDEEEMDREFSPYFSAEIVDITRVEPAEMTEEFFTSSFGPEVKTESEAKARIAEQQEEFFERQAQGLLLRNYQDAIMKKMDGVSYPDEFLKRWLLKTNEEATEEQIDKEYDGFIKNLTWTLIRNRLSEEYEIEVNQEEITNEMAARIQQYTRGMNLGEDFFKQTLTRMMQDREQVEGAYEEVALRKLSAHLRTKLNIDEILVSPEELNDKIREANEKSQADHNHED